MGVERRTGEIVGVPILAGFDIPAPLPRDYADAAAALAPALTPTL